MSGPGDDAPRPLADGLPADLPQWADVVRGAYGLEREVVTAGGFRAELFRCRDALAKSAFATAPYLSDGGVRIGPGFSAASAQAAVTQCLQDSGSSHLLLRTRRPLFEAIPGAVHVDTAAHTFVLPLAEGAEKIWTDRVHSKTRNQVRKGQKQGFDVRTGHLDLLDPFFTVITAAWRDLGTPSHHRDYYRQILTTLGDRAGLIVLFHRGAPISAALLIACDGTLHHPYAATLRAYNALSANNVLYWSIIEHGCRRGLQRFDLGRSRLDQGTYRYKLSWGATPVPLFYTYFLRPGAQPPDFHSLGVRLSVAAWQRLPVAVTRRLGPALIKRVL